MPLRPAPRGGSALFNRIARRKRVGAAPLGTFCYAMAKGGLRPLCGKRA